MASNSAAVKNGVWPNSVMLARSFTPGMALAKARNISALFSASGKIASAPASTSRFACAPAPGPADPPARRAIGAGQDEQVRASLGGGRHLGRHIVRVGELLVVQV